MDGEYEPYINAALYVAGSLLVVFILDRLLRRRGAQLTQAVVRGELSQETDTRLRFLRRLLYAVIVLIGCVTASMIPAMKFASVWRAAKPRMAAAIAPEASRSFGITIRWSPGVRRKV